MRAFHRLPLRRVVEKIGRFLDLAGGGFDLHGTPQAAGCRIVGRAGDRLVATAA